MRQQIGFSPNNNETTQEFYQAFLGKPGHYSVGPVSATGVLKEVNLEQKYIAVQPSIVGYDGRTKLVYDRPTIITIASGQPISMRPLEEEDLQTIIDEQDKHRLIREQKMKKTRLNGRTPKRIIIP